MIDLKNFIRDIDRGLPYVEIDDLSFYVDKINRKDGDRVKAELVIHSSFVGPNPLNAFVKAFDLFKEASGCYNLIPEFRLKNTDGEHWHINILILIGLEKNTDQLDFDKEGNGEVSSENVEISLTTENNEQTDNI